MNKLPQRTRSLESPKYEQNSITKNKKCVRIIKYAFEEYHYFDDDAVAIPIITLGTTEPETIIVETGTLPEDFYSTLQAGDVEMPEPVDIDTKALLIANYMNETELNLEQTAYSANTNNTGDKDVENKKNQPVEKSTTKNLEVRRDFSARNDGSVNCNICGKIFASRQHWYRHKYRAHVVNPPPDPMPRNKCEQCLLYFKSRKGYLGHMSSKHSETLQDVTPVLRNEQATIKLQETKVRPSTSGMPKPMVPDPEMAIPKTVLQNYQALQVTTVAGPSRSTSKTRSVDKKKTVQCTAKDPEDVDPRDYQRRVKDENFVMDIIEKVRRQCATEPGMANRRGYYKKPYPVGFKA